MVVFATILIAAPSSTNPPTLGGTAGEVRLPSDLGRCPAQLRNLLLSHLHGWRNAVVWFDLVEFVSQSEEKVEKMTKEIAAEIIFYFVSGSVYSTLIRSSGTTPAGQRNTKPCPKGGNNSRTSRTPSSSPDRG